MTDRALAEALAVSQRLGMLGGRPIDEVIAHAGAFVDALAGTRGTVVDLGSGGGVPGLVIARARPDLRLVLVDRRSTRADHLRRLVNRLGAADRIEVVAADAAALPRLIALPVDAVVAQELRAPDPNAACRGSPARRRRTPRGQRTAGSAGGSLADGCGRCRGTPLGRARGPPCRLLPANRCFT